MARNVSSLICAILILTPIISLSQPTNFEKLFRDTDVLYSVQQTIDNGYILSGLMSENGEPFVRLMKTNSEGDTIWTKKFPSIGKTDHYKTTAIETSDGDYILTGSMEDSNDINVFLIKTDAQGTLLWQKSYGDSVEERSWSVIETLDGGYLISAHRPLNYFYLIKTDFEGVIEWEKEFGPIFSLDRRGQAIQASDSSYYVIVKREFFRLNKAGEQIRQTLLNKRFTSIGETDDKNLILAGNNVLMKADSLGNEIWINQDLDIDPNTLQVTSDNGYILGGDKVLKLDDEGMVQWNLEMDGVVYSLRQTDDDGYVFCGGELPVPLFYNGWLIKTDQNGYYQALTLLRPGDNESINCSVDYLISWRQVNIDQINIAFSSNNGLDWEEVVTSIPADSNNYLWKVPFIHSDECKIRITATDQPAVYSENKQPFSIISRQYDYIAINQIKMWFANNGDGSHHPHTDGQGLLWPGGVAATQGAVFEDGLVFAGMINGDYYAGGNTHRQGLQAGNILADGSAANPDSSIFGVWKIRRDWGVYPPCPERDRLEHDYHNWPVQLGAPWVDNNGDGVYDQEVDQPRLYGDETNWMVMNDLDTATTQFFAGTDPIGLEIQCTIYGYDRQDALADVVFKRYKVFNKGDNFIDDMALGYWSDVDLGDAQDDFFGCDTLLDLGYCYNASNSDEVYGSPPPAVGYTILQGPIIEGSLGDSAWFNEEWLPAYKNLPMTSFMGHI